MSLEILTSEKNTLNLYTFTFRPIGLLPTVNQMPLRLLNFPTHVTPTPLCLCLSISVCVSLFLSLSLSLSLSRARARAPHTHTHTTRTHSLSLSQRQVGAEHGASEENAKVKQLGTRENWITLLDVQDQATEREAGYR